VYAPLKGRNTSVTVVVFPGVGYQFLAMDQEGTEICDWLTSGGITCVLLKYRVPNSGPTWENGRRHYPHVPTALQDAQRTLGLVRLQAARWKVDPHKLGVIGFSAGGHLVAAVSTHFEQRTYKAVDAAHFVEWLSCSVGVVGCVEHKFDGAGVTAFMNERHDEDGIVSQIADDAPRVH